MLVSEAFFSGSFPPAYSTAVIFHLHLLEKSRSLGTMLAAPEPDGGVDEPESGGGWRVQANFTGELDIYE